jgi:cytochrome P450
MRHARVDDEIGGCRIPRGSIVFWTMTLLHRHPDFWDRPTEFDPEHFAPEKVAERPRYAYVPFSSGPRQCVGNGFAMMEMTFALAMILQRYRFSLAPDQTIVPEPLLTLRPSGRVLATVTPR